MGSWFCFFFSSRRRHTRSLCDWSSDVCSSDLHFSDPDSIDDKDVMGVYIAPIEHYLGFGRQDVYEKWEGEWDCVFYELRKFIGLLLNCNPNVLSLLWLKDNGIIYESSLGRLLRENRDLFVTKKAYHSFSGYAHEEVAVFAKPARSEEHTSELQ